MPGTSKKQLVWALLDRHGRTYAEELGIDVRKQTPSSLFQLLCASALYSARIDSSIATEAARNLKRAGWRTAEKMADSTWSDRVSELNEAGSTRYQERTASMLGEMAKTVLDRWDGDLRKLRDQAERDPKQERRLLKEAKGIGDTGVDIFSARRRQPGTRSPLRRPPRPRRCQAARPRQRPEGPRPARRRRRLRPPRGSAGADRARRGPRRDPRHRERLRPWKPRPGQSNGCLRRSARCASG